MRFEQVFEFYGSTDDLHRVLIDSALNEGRQIYSRKHDKKLPRSGQLVYIDEAGMNDNEYRVNSYD